VRLTNKLIKKKQRALCGIGLCFALGVVMTLAVPGQAEAAGKGKTFKHKAVTMQLPPGWKIKLSPPAEKESIATFTSKKVRGASVVVLAYKKVFFKYSHARIRMLKNVASAYPGGQQQLKKKHKIKTDNGHKVWLELWRGMIPVGDKQVWLQSPTAIFRSRSKHWIVLIGFAPEPNAPWLEKEVRKMVESVK